MIFTEVQISKNNVETVFSTEVSIVPRFRLCPALELSFNRPQCFPHVFKKLRIGGVYEKID